MNLFASMDRLVRVTGLYRMTMIERPEPRTLRWLPLITLLAFPVGYTLMVKAQDGLDVRSAVALIIAGGLIFYTAFGVSFYLRFLGPRLIEDSLHPLDERERVIRDRAGYLSGTLISAMAMIGCFYFSLASFFHGWQPRSANEWATLGFAIQGTYFTLPVLVASWLQPRPNAE